MNICLILDNPETPRHPVIAKVLHTLSATYTVRLLDVNALSGAQAIAQEEMQPQADLYLLKSHAPQALDVAYYLEQGGAHVVNGWAATVTCQDRTLMTRYMNKAGLPWPHTWNFSSLKDLLEQDELLVTLPFPLIIKSRYSRRDDLVGKLHNVNELQSLAPQWSQEPVILQEFVVNDGWDSKLWVIDQQLFAARRRTPLEPNATKKNFPLTAEELPGEWVQITLEIGRVFNMQLYGVDLLVTERGPIIVDVNSFPGFRGVHGADSAIVALVEQSVRERLTAL
jgi:ribosomal protein S6--L-glutamate ligase